MNPAILAALINQIGIPELSRWLAARHLAGQPVTEADALALLKKNTDEGIATGERWLALHAE